MEVIRRFLVFIFFVCSFNTHGQTLENKHHRVLILLDASLSMNEPSDGYATKYAAASDFIIRLMDSIYRRNDEVEFGLRVYGHQYPASARHCFDTKLEVQFSRDNIEQMKMRLADVKPRGISNTYTALKEALEYDISSVNNYLYHVLIITDGGEACSGEDICSLSGLLKYKNVTTPCIVSTSNSKSYPCYTTGSFQMVKNNTDFTVNYYVKQCLQIPEKTISTNNQSSLQTSTISQLEQSPNKKIVIKYVPPNTLKAAQTPIIERPKSNGYLKISGITGTHIIYLYQFEKGVYTFFKTIEIAGDNISQRIDLPAGKYKLTCQNKEIILNIIEGMITEKQIK